MIMLVMVMKLIIVPLRLLLNIRCLYKKNPVGTVAAFVIFVVFIAIVVFYDDDDDDDDDDNDDDNDDKD